MIYTRIVFCCASLERMLLLQFQLILSEYQVEGRPPHLTIQTKASKDLSRLLFLF